MKNDFDDDDDDEDYQDVETYNLPHSEKTYTRATPKAKRIFEKRMRELGLKKQIVHLQGGHRGVIWR